MPESVNIQINISGNAVAEGNKLTLNFQKLTNVLSSIKTIKFAAIVDNIRNINESIKGAMQPGLDFQQQIADLSAITGIAGNDLNTLSDAARKVGKESGLGASQAAEAFKLLASNIDITKIGGVNGLKLLQKETIALSQAAGVDLATAADTMANTINQFKLSATEASRVINVLGAGAKYGAAEIPDLAASLKYVGPVAGAAGMSIEQVVGALEVLSQSGIKASDAGTDLSGILVRMQSVLGVDIDKVGLPKALAMLKPKLNDVTYLTKVFGLENLKSVQTLISNSDAVQEMTDKVTGTSTAYEQAKIRTNTYNTVLKKIKARFDDVKISIFNSTGALLPFVSIMGDGLFEVSKIIPALSAMASAVAFLTNKEKLASLWTGILTAKQWMLNIAMSANPIGLIAAAVAAFIAEVVLLVVYWEKVVNWYKKTAPVIKLLLAPMVIANWAVISLAFAIRFLIDHWKELVAWFNKIGDKIDAFAAGVKNKIKSIREWIAKYNPFTPIIHLIDDIFPGFQEKVNKILEWFNEHFIKPITKLFGGLKKALKWFFKGNNDSLSGEIVIKNEGKSFYDLEKAGKAEQMKWLSAYNQKYGTNVSYDQARKMFAKVRNQSNYNPTVPFAGEGNSSEAFTNVKGGEGIKNINVYITKVVDKFTIETQTIENGVSQTKEKMLDALLTVITDATRLA